MSETKFTPGPWQRNGTYIQGPRMALHVATVRAPAIGSAPKTKAEADANGDLIAAAPEMYEALRAIIEKSDDFLSTMGPNWEGDPLSDACTAAKSVLAKAEGRS